MKVELDVVRREVRLRGDNWRSDQRVRAGRPLASSTAVRWLERALRRACPDDTIASDVLVEVYDSHGDYFIRDAFEIRASVRVIVVGRRFGLGDRLDVSAGTGVVELDLPS